MDKFRIGDRVRVNYTEDHLAGEEGKVIATRHKVSDGEKLERYLVCFLPKYGTRHTYFADELLLVERNHRIRKAVYYTVNYRAVIEYDPRTEDEQDAISNIDIPEGGKHNSEYQDDSFDIYHVEDA